MKKTSRGASSSMCHSAHNVLEKISSFEEGKASKESAFRPLSSRNCLAFNTGDLQTFPEDLTFQSRQCVSRHIQPVNTFLGHTATAHEEAGCRSMFESGGCHTVFT